MTIERKRVFMRQKIVKFCAFIIILITFIYIAVFVNSLLSILEISTENMADNFIENLNLLWVIMNNHHVRLDFYCKLTSVFSVFLSAFLGFGILYSASAMRRKINTSISITIAAATGLISISIPSEYNSYYLLENICKIFGILYILIVSASLISLRLGYIIFFRKLFK